MAVGSGPVTPRPRHRCRPAGRGPVARRVRAGRHRRTPSRPRPTWCRRWTGRPSGSSSTLLAARPDDGAGGRGGQPAGNQRPALGDRSARRHHQLPLRPPRLGGVDRRRGRRRSSPWSWIPSTATFSRPAGAAGRGNGQPISCSTLDDAAPRSWPRASATPPSGGAQAKVLVELFRIRDPAHGRPCRSISARGLRARRRLLRAGPRLVGPGGRRPGRRRGRRPRCFGHRWRIGGADAGSIVAAGPRLFSTLRDLLSSLGVHKCRESPRCQLVTESQWTWDPLGHDPCGHPRGDVRRTAGSPTRPSAAGSDALASMPEPEPTAITPRPMGLQS